MGGRTVLAPRLDVRGGLRFPTLPAVVIKAMIDNVSQVASVNTYPIRWSLFVFGADLMHFDVEHPPTGGWGSPPRTAVVAAQTEVEKYFTGSNPGNVPWG
jgi:hypothetical protein